jgi:hypothetical protein
MEAAAVLEAAVVDIARSPFLRVLLRNHAIVVPQIFRRTVEDYLNLVVEASESICRWTVAATASSARQAELAALDRKAGNYWRGAGRHFGPAIRPSRFSARLYRS